MLNLRNEFIFAPRKVGDAQNAIKEGYELAMSIN